MRRSKLAHSCTEVCLDQGQRCAEDCDFGTPLPARAAYYGDLEACEESGTPAFVETASCDAAFDRGAFISYDAVRCCCAPMDFVPATVTEREKLCVAACDHDPYPAVRGCETFGSCESECIEATRGVEPACAECLAGEMTFTPSGCNSWECQCGGGQLPSYWYACDDACAATRAHERAVYAATPRPADVGRAPAVSSELPGDARISGILSDEGGRLWSIGSAGEPATPRAAVQMRDAGLNPLWTWEDPSGPPFRSAVGLARVGSETITMLNAGDGTAVLAFFDDRGFVREVASGVRDVQSIAALGDGLLVKHGANATYRLSALKLDGTVLYEAPASGFEGVRDPWQFAANASPPWWGLVSVVDAIVWRHVDAPGGVPSVAWTRTLPWRAIPSAYGLALAGDDMVVFGAERSERAFGSDLFPWVARLSPDGTERFSWSNGKLVTPGTISGAVRTAADHVCTVGRESWEHSMADAPASGPRCNPDRCESLTVRCFDAAGAELWRYHQRSTESSGYGIVAGPDDSLFVMASETRDANRSTGVRRFLHRFDP